MDESGSRFTCLFQYPDKKLKVKELQSGQISDTVALDGDAAELFGSWQKRLGLTINDVGKIAPAELGGPVTTPKQAEQ